MTCSLDLLSRFETLTPNIHLLRRQRVLINLEKIVSVNFDGRYLQYDLIEVVGVRMAILRSVKMRASAII